MSPQADKILISILLLLFVLPFPLQAQQDLAPFLAGFEKAAEKHKYKKVLAYMDHDHRVEQHDRFLQGRTKQFIDEFFCGYESLTHDGYHNIGLDRVEDLQLIYLEYHAGSWEATYRILTTDGGTYYYQYLIVWDEERRRLGFVGAVG